MDDKNESGNFILEERIESLETAVKSMQEQIDKILKTMEELTLGKN
jgi:prefoldin subunit 5